MGIITIARQAESGGEAVAEGVAKQLGIALVHRPRLERLMLVHGLSGPRAERLRLLPTFGLFFGPAALVGALTGLH